MNCRTCTYFFPKQNILIAEKPFSGNLKAKKSKFRLDMNHGHDTDFSKLVNLCPVKKNFLISTPVLCRSFWLYGQKIDDCHGANNLIDFLSKSVLFCKPDYITKQLLNNQELRQLAFPSLKFSITYLDEDCSNYFFSQMLRSWKYL